MWHSQAQRSSKEAGEYEVTYADSKKEFVDGYRSVMRFDLQPGETILSITEGFVRDWLRSRKEGVDKDTLDLWDGQTHISLPGGTHVERTLFTDPRSKTTAVRYVMTDTGIDADYRVSISAANDTSAKNSRALMVISVARNEGTLESIIDATHPPRIVANILNDRHVFDGAVRLQGQPVVIRESDLWELRDAIADQDRQVSLIVASSVSTQADVRWRQVVGALTRTSIGTAAVYSVDAAAVGLLNDELPPALRVQPGHLRVIAPRVDMDNPDSRRHPLITPDTITTFLGRRGRPTEEALAEVARSPRRQLLETALPAEVRRVLELLDQEARKAELVRKVEQQVEDFDLSRVELEATPTKGRQEKRIFPRRADRHREMQSGGDFWQVFRASLGRWLDKPASEISEASIEEDIVLLDRRIIRDRSALEVQEEFLSSAEAERNSLNVELAVLREEKDSLEALLESTRKQLTDAHTEIESLREQLEHYGVRPIEPEALDEGDDQAKQVRLLAEILGNGIDAVDGRVEVGRALDLLASRLDSLIQATLANRLCGNHWVKVLEQLDRARGRAPGMYSADDPSAQLRMLTERLGDWGYPFDTGKTREVSAVAQQLRTLRHGWAHYATFDQWDGLRAHDAAHRLFELLGDREGAAQAEAMRVEVTVRLGLDMLDSERDAEETGNESDR
ncbi:hypothetical protein FYJ24_10495 [Actinomycetaceae bacterium WB03_NA08]|uniref:Swt1-like HEPN domain-containing protein n=1 Tax=Scrofimicrobium canadense TaxID=2652290 RepID=A0A6N7VTS2_9ACTO|nr:Swt1 family HEPN domain-containing protein [Scrofimicrobium canadense]MSS85177.1 hypothetical protein [Scrofimicrobium canadense]